MVGNWAIDALILKIVKKYRIGLICDHQISIISSHTAMIAGGITTRSQE